MSVSCCGQLSLPNGINAHVNCDSPYTKVKNSELQKLQKKKKQKNMQSLKKKMHSSCSLQSKPRAKMKSY